MVVLEFGWECWRVGIDDFIPLEHLKATLVFDLLLIIR